VQAHADWHWQYEGIAFYLQVPDANGNCPLGTTILYRLYNNGMGGTPAHRLTTSEATFNQMLAEGWITEGDGRTFAFACVPSSTAPSTSYYARHFLDATPLRLSYGERYQRARDFYQF
jgi:hypothetical protein